MPLSPQSLSIPFSTGVDTKTDPKQVLPTNLLSLVNAVYTKDKMLTKRNGFGALSTLPDNNGALSLTTFKDNLTVIGSSILAYNASNETWIDRGRYQGCELSVLSVAKNSSNLVAADAAVSEAKNWVCSTYSDGTHSFYQVQDLTTSQLLLSPVQLPTTAKSARAFVLGNNFIVTFMVTVTATPTLRYIAIPFASLVPLAAVTISAQVKSISHGYDCIELGGVLYIAWSGSDMGGSIRATRLSSALGFYTTKVIATGSDANLLTVAIDDTNFWVTWYQTSDTSLHATAQTLLLVEVLPDTTLDDTQTLSQIASVEKTGHLLEVICDVDNDYSFGSIETDFITKITCTTAGTTVGPTEVVRSLGLGSKAFLEDNVAYFLGAFDSAQQPSYFLCDDSGAVLAKLAYSNGGGYIPGAVLPSVSLIDGVAYIAYQIKDLLVSVAKAQPKPNAAQTGPTNIYTQTGINLASFDLTPAAVSSAEIGDNLHISGGYVWAYDGTNIVEHNYHVWPEDIGLTAGTSGSMIAQLYQYQVVYEWTDAQGTIHRSAPSVPQSITLGGGDDSVILDLPTLRLTYKNDVRIVVYRWSTAQQAFYQTTSITSPVLNDTTVDSVSYEDTLADAAILGNPLIYTTGGVIENIAYPATKALALYKSRLMALSSENRNVVWYSKQVVQTVPVEPSDAFTMYVSPTAGAQGSTGPSTVISAMDDKFIIGKENAWNYVTGDGPLNTGADNNFSEPTFISSVVGCTNQASLVLSPHGLMFRSNKGIWLLGRDLSTQYIGAPVEDFNGHDVTSAVLVPGTNQVRFLLDNGQALMYDYFFARWGSFDSISTIASTIYQGLHTYLTPQGQVRRETPGLYLDGTRPTVMGFTTAWINAAGIQGLERIWTIYLLGTYISPHRLSISISYDYENGATQSLILTPDNFVGAYGVDPVIYGQGGPYGGPGNLEQWQVFPNRQKVQSIKLQVQELYDPSLGEAPGAGLTFSNLNFEVGLKKGTPLIPARRSIG